MHAQCVMECVYNSKEKRRTEGEADSTKAKESQQAFVPICMLISMSYWESNAGQQVNSSYPSVILMACLPGQFDSSVRELISPHVQWASTASSDLLLKTSLHPLSMRRHTHTHTAWAEGRRKSQTHPQTDGHLSLDPSFTQFFSNIFRRQISETGAQSLPSRH